jgi:serine/threonine protein kinase
MRFLHAKNVVHLDIKPDNVLLREPCDRMNGIEDLHIQICDFGLAKSDVIAYEDPEDDTANGNEVILFCSGVINEDDHIIACSIDIPPAVIHVRLNATHRASRLLHIDTRI